MASFLCNIYCITNNKVELQNMAFALFMSILAVLFFFCKSKASRWNMLSISRVKCRATPVTLDVIPIWISIIYLRVCSLVGFICLGFLALLFHKSSDNQFILLSSGLVKDETQINESFLGLFVGFTLKTNFNYPMLKFNAVYDRCESQFT